MAASQIKVLLDELAAILAEMGALDEGATDALDPTGEEAEVVVEPGMDEAARADEMMEGEEEEEDDEEEVVEQAKARSMRSLIKRANSIKRKISLLEAKAKVEAQSRAVLERAAPATALQRKAVEMGEKRVYATPRASLNLRAFRGEGGEERAYRAGMHLRGFVFGDANARNWCYEHGVESRAQAGGVNSLGGVLTSPEMSDEIIRLVEEYGVFPRYARRVTMASDTLVIARRVGGLTAKAVGENAEVATSDLEFDNVELVARIWGVANRIPNSLMEDSVVQLADLMAVEIAQAYSEAFDNSGFIGDGSSQYHATVGVCTRLLQASSAGSLVASGQTSFAALTMTNFTDLVAKLPLYARNRNARWYISPAGWGAAMLRLSMLPGGGTGPGGNNAENIAAGFGERFLGYPVTLVHSMESSLSTINSGSVACIFGDLSQACTFGERRAIAIKTSADRYMEFDQTLTFSTTRNAMVAHDTGSATKAGPVVALKFGS